MLPEAEALDPMLIDAHCHLQAEEFDPDRGDVLARCRDRGMQCIVVGNQLADSEKAVKLAAEHSNLFAVVGIHPIYAHDEAFSEPAFEKLLQHERVVGIGEIGLDYNRIWADTKEEEEAEKEKQRTAFLQQLAFARKHRLPVVIHCRDAYDDLLTLLNKHGAQDVMVHTFLGDAATAQRFLALGVTLSFSGIVTFEDEEALLEALRAVPLDRMLIETDAPYLAPVPYRGKRNEPMYVDEVAKKIAEVHGVAHDHVVAQTAANAQTFFRLPTP